MPIQGNIGGGAIFGGKEPHALETADNGGWLPLHYACRYKPPLEVVQFLVERKPTALGMANMTGELPFDIACQQEASLEVLRVLVERTPARGKLTDDGQELLLPLHFTCSRRKRLDSLRWLLGIDPSAVETANADGSLPLHLACTAQA
jgi:ankyrin repeat protein